MSEKRTGESKSRRNTHKSASLVQGQSSFTNLINATTSVTLDVVDPDFDRKETEEYVKSRNIEHRVLPSPQVDYLDRTVFPLLKQGLIHVLVHSRKLSKQNRRTTFNGLDHLSEFLYNKNPNHPEREGKWMYIFDMPWVEDYLKDEPRPHYPFSVIWSENFAALKIQSFMRGYWVRRESEVQELRQFWKALKAKKVETVQ